VGVSFGIYKILGVQEEKCRGAGKNYLEVEEKSRRNPNFEEAEAELMGLVLFFSQAFCTQYFCFLHSL